MNSAFTLVELAIVIVIIGLLVGGVLQGQELIKQAQYRGVMKDIESYRASAATFLSKYNCLPGDCINAYKFFSGKNCGTDTVVGISNSAGCNGNGDKIIVIPEGQVFWQHLSYANLIKGTFPAGYRSLLTRDNVPPSSLSSSGVSIIYSRGNIDAATACGFSWCSNDGRILGGQMNSNMIIIANITPDVVNTSYARGPLLSPIDAFEFDVKFDDGLYYSGPISGHNARDLAGADMDCGTHSSKTYSSATVNDRACVLVATIGL
jgi:prepilin-type N-terminal cleavage/methylation domain-containing protein